jgi:hypothetical protein
MANECCLQVPVNLSALLPFTTYLFEGVELALCAAMDETALYDLDLLQLSTEQLQLIKLGIGTLELWTTTLNPDLFGDHCCLVILV